MNKRKTPELKTEFVKRMKELLTEEKDFQKYLEILKIPPVRSIRCNTLKINPEKLKIRLEKKGWKIIQPWPKNPEVMTIDNNLEPGELGRSIEHILGYYYIQELASMLPPIALNPQPHEKILDLCASPGSKTTQIASYMNNTGSIVANEISLGRIKILAANLERCGVANTIITKKEGIALCKKFKRLNYHFNKILIDAPCSGEGTLRSSIKTYTMWNPKTITSLSRTQRQLLDSAISILSPKGTIIYSTCTHAPEENEEVVNYILNKYPELKIEKISLPINPREGLTRFRDTEYAQELKYACRVYPQDNNTEGFFLAKLTKR